MSNIVKPLLAAKLDMEKVRFPLSVTPKLDGIRCLMVNGVAMSRKMKPIPNRYVQEQLADLHGLDGELMLRDPSKDFNDVQSGIMSEDGEPDFVFHVFDTFADELKHLGYEDRTEHLFWATDNERIKILTPVQLHTEAEVLVALDRFLEAGYEGLMARDPNGPYKHGRSTANQGILLKLKKFFDDEATVVDTEEKMINGNEAELDELGYTKRSSHKANQIPAGTAGAVLVEWKGHQFKLGFGPGWTDARKQEWWDAREEKKGATVTFSYQELSKDGIPRFGKLLHERHGDDLL